MRVNAGEIGSSARVSGFPKAITCNQVMAFLLFMTTNTDTERDNRRLTAAIRLVIRQYWGQVRRRRAAALGALVLPALADILTYYAPPLVIARLLGTFARGGA